MSSTFTSTLSLEKPGNGEQDGAWGDTVNANMDLLDAAVAARVERTAASQTITGNVAVTGNVTVTGTLKAIGAPITAEVSFGGITNGAVLHNPAVNATAGRGMDLAFQASTGGAAAGYLAVVRAVSTTAANNTGELQLYGVAAGTVNLGVTVKADGSVALAQGATIVDTSFVIYKASATVPRIQFDTGDFYQYDRTANAHSWWVGGANVTGINTDGPYRNNDAASANQLPRKSQLDAATAQATDAARGTVELATNAEVITGTDPARVVTPAALKNLFTAAQSLGTSGYQTLPGGLIIQWARGVSHPANTSETPQTITFPTPFPNAVFAVFVSTEIPSVGNTTDVWYQTVASASLTSVTVQPQYTGTGAVSTTFRPIIFAVGN